MLKAVKKVKIRDWMVFPETTKIMRALEADRQRALFVGGCVRNTLLGLEAGDIDIATQWTPQEVTKKLSEAGVKVIPTGIDHGTVTAVMNKKSFEITTLRRDVETDGRRAVVAFTQDWKEDAQRRDFTMNTLLADEKGNVYDPTGKGLKDLQAGKVKFVGEAKERIAEDYLRILRFFRFHAMVGKGKPDAMALKACAAAAGKIKTLSRERITQEFFRILSVDEPADILALMFKNKVLKEFSFREYEPRFFQEVCLFQNRFGLAFIASRLLVLAGLKTENINKIEQLLLIPKVFKRDMEMVSQVLALPDLEDDHAVRMAVYKHGRVATAQALMIELAQDRVMNGYAPKAIKIIQKWEVPDFPLTGHDLKKAGIKEGPEMGRVLAALEEWWVSQDFQPDKAACLSRLPV